jgi:hypothetical protein
MTRLLYSAAFAAVAVMATAPAASAQASWPIIYKSKDVSVALDTAGAERNTDGSYVSRTRWDYAAEHKLESKRPYTQMTEVALLRCTPVRIKRLTESFYAEGGAAVREGPMPSPGEVQYMTWDRLPVRSEGSKVFSNVCATMTKKFRGKR